MKGGGIIKTAPYGGILETPPGGLVCVWFKLAYEVRGWLFLSPGGAVPISSPLNSGRDLYDRRPPSLNDSAHSHINVSCCCSCWLLLYYPSANVVSVILR